MCSMSLLDETQRRRHADRSGDSPEVMRRFVEHRPLAARLAQRYVRTHDRDDLLQVADLALLTASRRFDPQRGAFERYAVVSIVGELKKHMRRTGWSAHVPRRVQEHALAVQNSIDRLTVDLGRSPLLSEIADDCRFSAEQVSEALRARSGRFAGGDVTLARQNADNSADGCVEGLVVRWAVDRLAAADRELISLVFDGGLTQREIGDRIGVSQSQVQRRLARVLDALRADLATDSSSTVPTDGPTVAQP